MSNLLKDNIELMKEYNNEKNHDIDLNNITLGSNKKIWWKCSKGHEWEASIYSRKNNKCPICSNKMILVGINDLATVNPELAKEWNYEKNGELKPTMVTRGSQKKVWWKCEKGHEWEASIHHRNNGSGCPICANKQVLKGYNDLATINPELAKEWNNEKNGKLKPDMITANSNKKVWWKCKEGHEWQVDICNRNNGYGCPICANRKIIKGYNDLATINPELAKEWNYEKNGKLKPDMITANSNKKVWWKCEKGHEWQVSIVSRNSSGSKCPICAKELQTSFPEQAIYYYIRKLFPDAINGDRRLGVELDIYIPSKKFAIEYDGIFWHKDKKRDERKNNICKENKIVLLRVREDKNCDWKENKYLRIVHCTGSDASIEESIKIIVSYLGQQLDINLNRDRTDIYSSFIKSQKEGSLQNVNPDLADEWNDEKNGDLKPDMVSPNSQKKVWWKCEKGHEWQSPISNRNSGAGCPFCSGQQLLKGFNDLNSINPELAKEWNYEKNGKLKPDMVTSGSIQKVWWKCEKGHELQATVSNRKYGKTGCPICANMQVLKGYNDLPTVNSELFNEWNYEKNGNLDPSTVKATSEKKVWWKCEKGHEWKTSINCRNQGNGCPICANMQVLKGYNDLATINPNLAKEWNYKKNGSLKPDMVIATTQKKVWWRCEKGHEWKTDIKSRNAGNGCPICSNKQVLKGYNDLATINPELAKEWNYKKNGSLKPDMVTIGSSKKVWWKCEKGHEWEVSVGSRRNGSKCPICLNAQVLEGYNDLNSVNPELAKEWNYENNGDLKPTMITEKSGKKVWWKCKKGHEWIAEIKARNNGTGCPICSNKQVLKGYNDLLTTNPGLAKEWNYEKNGSLKPDMVTEGSAKKVWWKCEKGHEWQATISNRSKGYGKCRICN